MTASLGTRPSCHVVLLGVALGARSPRRFRPRRPGCGLPAPQARVWLSNRVSYTDFMVRATGAVGAAAGGTADGRRWASARVGEERDRPHLAAQGCRGAEGRWAARAQGGPDQVPPACAR